MMPRYRKLDDTQCILYFYVSCCPEHGHGVGMPPGAQVCDVSSLASVAALVDEVEGACTPLHCLINNAGVMVSITGS